jgi:hypothetical protein
VFADIETIRGSGGNDAIVLDRARLAGTAAFDGGASAPAHWDELILRGARRPIPIPLVERS